METKSETHANISCCVVACSNKQRKGLNLSFFGTHSAIRTEGAYLTCLFTEGNFQYAASWIIVCASLKRTAASINEKHYGSQIGACFPNQGRSHRGLWGAPKIWLVSKFVGNI